MKLKFLLMLIFVIKANTLTAEISGLDCVQQRYGINKECNAVSNEIGGHLDMRLLCFPCVWSAEYRKNRCFEKPAIDDHTLVCFCLPFLYNRFICPINLSCE